ncbi:MAG: tRNA (adenosine(37)-N6)-threonylcarbamoyltransferase complex dimerization subunit type 1 TsaB [Tannerellaceae bacterium]|nr:tRNA (adenosine(37)-N6)-threonylcarbamoyltransferase complex dimerization subunit type 1 TsaB [Tannerellaceae bacterium]
MILLIETSTTFCSVALSSQEKILYYREAEKENAHAEVAAVYVQEMLTALGEEERPDAVAVSCGPGSYTGLRIGVSLAKGICFGYGIPLIGIPLIGIPTLDILVSAAKKECSCGDCRYIAVLDTRGKEVYYGVYNQDLRVLRQTKAGLITEETFIDCMQSPEVFFVGSGAYKCRELYNRPNVRFLEDIHPKASDMAIPAERAFLNSEFVDVAYFEPLYFRDFQPTLPKKKIF